MHIHCLSQHVAASVNATLGHRSRLTEPFSTQGVIASTVSRPVSCPSAWNPSSATLFYSYPALPLLAQARRRGSSSQIASKHTKKQNYITLHSCFTSCSVSVQETLPKKIMGWSTANHMPVEGRVRRNHRGTGAETEPGKRR